MKYICIRSSGVAMVGEGSGSFSKLSWWGLLYIKGQKRDNSTPPPFKSLSGYVTALSKNVKRLLTLSMIILVRIVSDYGLNQVDHLNILKLFEINAFKMKYNWVFFLKLLVSRYCMSRI